MDVHDPRDRQEALTPDDGCPADTEQVVFAWTEPRPLRRARERALRRPDAWKGKVIAIGIVVLVMMVHWGLAHTRTDRRPQPWYIALGLSLFLGVFLVLVVPLILMLCPSRLRLGSQGIEQVVGNRRVCLPYDQIVAVEVATIGPHRCLRCSLTGGDEMVYGLDRRVDGSALLAACRRRLPTAEHNPTSAG